VSDGLRRLSPLAGPDAALVVDTREEERQLGTRSQGFSERRLLYRTSRAHVELRIPVAALGGEDAWLCGHYVLADEARRGGGANPVRFCLTDDAGHVETVEGSETGEFVLACDPLRPFTLVCEDATGAVSVLRYRP